MGSGDPEGRDQGLTRADADVQAGSSRLGTPAQAPTPTPSAPLKALPLLAAAGFTSMVSMRLCDAMLPELARAFAAPPAQTARVISAFAVAYGVLQLVYGPAGDRFGKPRVIGWATALCALGSLAAALAPGLDSLTLARVVMGAGAAGIIPLALAWIGDQVPFESRQEVLARYMSATVMGMMLGAWAGGLFAQTLGWRTAFGLVAVLFGGVTLALRRATARDRVDAPAPRAGARPSYRTQLRAVLADPWARRVLGVVFVEGAFVFGSMAFVPSVLHARFDLPLARAGAVVAAFGLGGLAYTRGAGWLLRRLGAPRLAQAGTACLAAGLVVLALLPHWALSVPACLVAGLGFYGLHNTLQVNATQLSTQARGTAVSLFACSLFLGQSFGVSLAARAFARWPGGEPYAAAALVLAALGAYFASQLRRRHRLG